MNDRNYLITMLIMGIFLIISLFYLAATTDAFSSSDDIANEKLVLPRFEAIPEQTIECALCHRQPENLTEHINGGNYCAACHGIDLHELHNKELECNNCHGNNVKIPQRLDEHPVICDACHGYPDPMAPSYGNLMTIHTARGLPCDICHIQDIQSLHQMDEKSAKYSAFTK